MVAQERTEDPGVKSGKVDYELWSRFVDLATEMVIDTSTVTETETATATDTVTFNVRVKTFFSH